MAVTTAAQPCQWCGAQSPLAPLFEGKFACTKHLSELLAARRRTAETDAAMEAVAEAFRKRIASTVPGPLASRPDLRRARRERENREWVTLVRDIHSRVYPVPVSRIWADVGVRQSRRMSA